MKQILAGGLALAMLASCGNSDQQVKNSPLLTAEEKKTAMADTSAYTSIEWLDGTSQDLGKVVDGQVVEVSFRFRNTGSKNLIIEEVKAGCGCTAPEDPGRPYAPGEEGTIRAKFDSRGREGVNDKWVTVKANTSPTREHVLNFKVTVTK